MTAMTKSGYKAVGGVETRFYPPHFTLIFFIFLLSVACAKELTRYPEIQAYHQESLSLTVASVDSVGKFSTKVRTFVAHHPDAAQDPLYPAIEQNIRQNLLRLSITINDEWDGETEINY